MPALNSSPTSGADVGRSVSLDRACALLRVSRRTVYNWIRAGRLQTVRTLGGSQRVLVDSLLENARRSDGGVGGALNACAAEDEPSPWRLP